MNLIEIPKLVDKNITINYPRKIPYIFMQNSAENFLSPSIAKNILKTIPFPILSIICRPRIKIYKFFKIFMSIMTYQK